MKQMRWWFYRLALLANLLCLGATIIALMAQHIPPAKLWIPALFGLPFPFLIVFNLFFLFFWLAMRKPYFLYSLFILLVGYQHLLALFPNPIPSTTENQLTLFTYNHPQLCKQLQINKQKELLDSLFKASKADIYCFQETNCRQGLVTIQKHFPEFHMASVNYQPTPRSGSYGLLIISRFPIISSHAINHHKRALGLQTDLLVGSDTLRLINVHLQSIRLTAEKRFLHPSQIVDTEATDQLLEGGHSLLTKMRKAYRIRSPQVDLLRQQISASPYPLILCGDFNDVPVSYTHHQLTQQLHDSGAATGHGVQRTFAEGRMPLRIDYILADKKFKAGQYQVHQVPFSDHYPVSCCLHYTSLFGNP